jgi:hypothetical protein
VKAVKTLKYTVDSLCFIFPSDWIPTRGFVPVPFSPELLLCGVLRMRDAAITMIDEPEMRLHPESLSLLAELKALVNTITHQEFAMPWERGRSS